MNTTLETISGNTRKITVTVPAADVDAAVKEVYREAGKKYRFPGFRPGKAPRHVIDNMLGGADALLAEATEKLVNKMFPLALDAEDIRPTGKTDFEEIDSVVEGQDFSFAATFDVRPQLTLSSLDDITIELPPVEATDAEIDQQLTMIADQFASLAPVEDRGVEAADFALISFVGDVDGEPYEGNTVDKYLYELSKGMMPADFDLGLLGMTPGETKRIEFEIPASEDNDEFAGKKAGFEVTLHEIKGKSLPEIDGEFAKMVGGFDSVATLREEVAKSITAQKAQSIVRVKEQRTMLKLAERLEGEVPEILVTEKNNELLQDFYRTLQQREMDFDSYLAAVGVDFAKFQEDMLAQSRDLVSEELALEALFRAKGMEITDTDIDDEFRRAVEGDEKADPAAMRARWEESGLMAMLREGIRRSKAADWIMDNVKVVEVAVPEAAEVDTIEE